MSGNLISKDQRFKKGGCVAGSVFQARSPAVHRMLSAGKKKPKNKPDLAKMMPKGLR